MSRIHAFPIGHGVRPHDWPAWTPAGLLGAYALAAAGCGLDEIAEAHDRHRNDVDQALHAKLGRTPEAALERLNRERGGPRPPRGPSSWQLHQFMTRTFAE